MPKTEEGLTADQAAALLHMRMQKKNNDDAKQCWWVDENGNRTCEGKGYGDIRERNKHVRHPHLNIQTWCTRCRCSYARGDSFRRHERPSKEDPKRSACDKKFAKLVKADKVVEERKRKAVADDGCHSTNQGPQKGQVQRSLLQ